MLDANPSVRLATSRRRAGFPAAGGAWRAALGAVKAHADLWQAAIGVDRATREAVDAFVAELDAEIAAAGA